MGGIPHDHYEPKSKATKAINSRLPIIGLLYDTLMIPTPKNPVSYTHLTLPTILRV